MRGLWIKDETPSSPHARRTLLLAGGFETNTLTELDVDFAKELAKQQRGLSFDRLSGLSVEVAEQLSQHEGHILWFGGMTEFSEPVASALAKHWGGLGFNGLRQLTDQVAVTLAKSQGDLTLNGLSRLSLQAAMALGGHEGDLTLEGLKILTDGAALALANHRGRVFIDQLQLSPQAAKALRDGKGEICGEMCEREPRDLPRQNVWRCVYLRSVWDNGDGAVDIRVSYEIAEDMAYALVRAMNFTRAMNDSLGGSLRDFFSAEAGDGDSHVTVDEFAAKEEPGIPFCDEFAVLVDEDDHIHFCPFEWQTVMSAQEWSAVFSLWRPCLAKAPLDDDDRVGWQVCLTKAEFLGQSE